MKYINIEDNTWYSIGWNSSGITSQVEILMNKELKNKGLMDINNHFGFHDTCYYYINDFGILSFQSIHDLGLGELLGRIQISPTDFYKLLKEHKSNLGISYEIY